LPAKTETKGIAGLSIQKFKFQSNSKKS